MAWFDGGEGEGMGECVAYQADLLLRGSGVLLGVLAYQAVLFLGMLTCQAVLFLGMLTLQHRRSRCLWKGQQGFMPQEAVHH
jgi:hypothetical protein